ncbi:hypothetical protein EC968_008968 [Mortierella alpina]|nr:hypothetical protein EC968_008968 [Mortierella alpina]
MAENVMTASEQDDVSSVEVQDEQQTSVQERVAPPRDPSRMTMDVEQLTAVTILPHGLPAYRTMDTAVEEDSGVVGLDTADDMQTYKDSDDDNDHAPGGYYRAKSPSEVDLQQEQDFKVWVNPPGDSGDLVAQSSDDYEDDIGDEEDEVDDDDDEFSDDTGDLEETRDIPIKNDFVYSRVAHHGPYLKSRRQIEQLKKNQHRSGTLRKKPMRLRTVSGAGSRLDAGPGSNPTTISVQDEELEAASPERFFIQTCEEVSLKLHQGPTQQVVDALKGLIKHSLDWRSTGVVPRGCQYSVDQLITLENSFFAIWAKLLTERRPSPLNTTIVVYLQDFVRLGCAIVKKEGFLPDLYAEVLTAMFEKSDLEIYRRNPKRPSRLAHMERMTRFQEYASEYSTEEDEVSQLQQDLQRLFSSLGGVDACITAIETHLESAETADVKIKYLGQLLGLISRIQVASDLGSTHAAGVSELSKRLIAAVLAYFPDHGDSFRSASKTAVLEIIAYVGVFLVENYRVQTPYSSLIQEPDADYEEFDVHDPISRSNLGEAKFADFRLEMAVRLMKTSRLDLRLTGLVELKEVLVRIQRLQQGRSRLRRRSEADMEVQMEQDRVPIEYVAHLYNAPGS